MTTRTAQRSSERRLNTDAAEAYLRDGGIGEVYGLADLAMRLGQQKVQMDTDMAIALCRLAAPQA